MDAVKNKITIRDIARQCGTSISTVSRVINGSAGVEAKLKANVLSAIQECDWQSNNLRLKFSRKSKVKPYVVVVSSFRGRSPDLSAVAPVSKLCAECDFKDLYFFSCDSQTMEFCRCVNPYALILISSVGSRRIEVEKLIESGTRVLYLGHGEIEPHKGASCYVPIGEFIRYSVDLLRQKGHTKIGYFGQFGEYAHFSGANHHSPRQNDAVETLRSLIPGFNVRNDTVGDCYGNFSALHDVLRQKRITGWICGTGNMGRWFCEEAEKLGLRIPEDLSVLALSGIEIPPERISSVEAETEQLEAALRDFLLSDPFTEKQIALRPRLRNPGRTLAPPPGSV